MVVAVGTPDDDDRLRDTRRQIRQLVNEIEALSRSDIPAATFYGEFLGRVVAGLAAVGGAVWVVDESRDIDELPAPLKLRYQINLPGVLSQAESDLAAQLRHSRILHDVLDSGATLVSPKSSAIDSVNPTASLLVLAPICLKGKPIGVVEIFQRPTSGPASQRGYLRFLKATCEHLAFYLERQPQKSDAALPERKFSFLSFLAKIKKWLFRWAVV